jgi:hypothetical protein
MSTTLIPLDTSPGQTWQVSVPINGGVSQFQVTLQYNEVVQVWEGTFYDGNGNLLIDSLPLVTGTNLFQQFGYLNMGSLYIVNASGIASPDYPNDFDLGSDFQLLWGDSVAAAETLA